MEISNYADRLAIAHPSLYTDDNPSWKGRSQDHATQFLGPITSVEWRKLESLNFVHT